MSHSTPPPPTAPAPSFSQLPRRVFLCSGEPSGDLHGAELIHHLRELSPQTRFYGIGGRHMAAAGMEQITDSADMALMGAVEVIRHLPRLAGIFTRVMRVFDLEPPDLIILIDYPEFNFRVGLAAAKRGLPVYYYISPQVWAWRQKRVFTMRRFVRKMFVLFPFEVTFYEQAGLPCEFVGNPLVEEVRARLDPERFRSQWNLDPSARYVCLMPGSRRQEIARLLDPVLKAASLIHAEAPDVRFLLPVPGHIDRSMFGAALRGAAVPVTLVTDDATNALAVSVAAIVKSGTSTLEACVVGTPFVTIYKFSPVSWLLAQILIKVKHAAMVNVIAGREIVKEFLQNEVQAEPLAREILRFLSEPETREQMKREFRDIVNSLSGESAPLRAAQAMLRSYGELQPRNVIPFLRTQHPQSAPPEA